VKTLAQITDLHLDDFLADHYQVDTRKNVLAVLDNVRQRGIGEVVLTGDLGNRTSLDWLFETLQSSGLRYRILLGNHDERQDFATRAFPEPPVAEEGFYYSSVLEDVLCLFLDSSSGTVGPRQLKWLGERLADKTDQIIVFIHHPVLDCGQTTMDRLYPLLNRDEVAAVLKKADRPVSIFCGHYHNRHEQTQGTLTQYLTPATLLQMKTKGDAPTPESRSIGYRILEFDKTTLRTEVVEVLG